MTVVNERQTESKTARRRTDELADRERSLLSGGRLDIVSKIHSLTPT